MPRSACPCLASTLRLLSLLLTALAAGAAQANDFPTVARVLYVHECQSDHPGPGFEMVHKCSCVVDKLAGQLRFAEYENLSTAAKASTIGGERGSYIRENEALQADVRRYRQLQTEAKKACFVLR